MQATSLSKSETLDYLFGSSKRLLAAFVSTVIVLQLMRLSRLWTPFELNLNPWKHQSEILLWIGCAMVGLVIAWAQGGFLQSVQKDDISKRLNRIGLSFLFSLVLALGLWFMNILRPRNEDFMQAISMVPAVGCFIFLLKSTTIGIIKDVSFQSRMMFLLYVFVMMGTITFACFIVTNKVGSGDKGVAELWLFGIFGSPIGLLLYSVIPQAMRWNSDS